MKTMLYTIDLSVHVYMSLDLKGNISKVKTTWLISYTYALHIYVSFIAASIFHTLGNFSLVAILNVFVYKRVVYVPY